MKKRKICIVTGSRADYGLLYWLMKEIHQDRSLRLQLVVTGSHLSKDHGMTYREILRDGFKIDKKIPILTSDDSAVGVTQALGKAVIGFAESFKDLKPDWLVVLGDRYEILAAAQAALIARIPIVHIHGGEATEGLIDEAIRHSITKMSQLHFVATENYRRRVIQLGEDPSRVFNFGAPGLDHVRRMPLLTKSELEHSLGTSFKDINLLATYHPVTLWREKDIVKSAKCLFKALSAFPGARIFFTKSNADTFGQIINRMIDTYAKKNSLVACFHSLGSLKYLSLLKQVDVIVGNSSSGIIEAPFLKIPTVNIGDRQRGRLRAVSVIDCGDSVSDIASAIKKALSPEFKRLTAKTRSVYGSGNTSRRIKEKLKIFPLSGILMKKFYDFRGKR